MCIQVEVAFKNSIFTPQKRNKYRVQSYFITYVNEPTIIFHGFIFYGRSGIIENFSLNANINIEIKSK
jgi:hypothetical protein